jgi:Protein of unknown function (DUF3667)
MSDDMKPSTMIHPDGPNCKNCGHVVVAKYCGQCGQSHQTGKLSVAHILREIPHAIFHLERGMIPTLYGLALRPGVTINSYLNGRRKSTSNPLTLLLIMAGVYAIANSIVDAQSAAASDGRSAGATWRLFSEYLLLMLAVQLPLTALTTRLLFRNNGRLYGEHLVIHTFIFAFTCVIGTVLVLMEAALHSGYYTAAFYLSNGGYQILAMYATFAPRARNRSVPLLKSVLAFLAYSALNTATVWGIAKAYEVLKA